MNFQAWMLFVPLWLTFSYSLGAYALWTGFFHTKVVTVDFAGVMLSISLRALQASRLPTGSCTSMGSHGDGFAIRQHSMDDNDDNSQALLFSPAVDPLPIGLIYGPRHYVNDKGQWTRPGPKQLGMQISAALFIIALNVVVTSIICLVIQIIVPLRMSDEALDIGDDAAHGEEAYSIWGDGEALKRILTTLLHRITRKL
ncbi:hypothetical protein SUGI_0110370 [Cryptomeria japonica]|nr:hypothetical protein SUGI_0110370 [Cryptomeria japonica]